MAFTPFNRTSEISNQPDTISVWKYGRSPSIHIAAQYYNLPSRLPYCWLHVRDEPSGRIKTLSLNGNSDAFKNIVSVVRPSALRSDAAGMFSVFSMLGLLMNHFNLAPNPKTNPIPVCVFVSKTMYDRGRLGCVAGLLRCGETGLQRGWWKTLCKLMSSFFPHLDVSFWLTAEVQRRMVLQDLATPTSEPGCRFLSLKLHQLSSKTQKWNYLCAT